jgi:SAM-dependent methyltransferase
MLTDPLPDVGGGSGEQTILAAQHGARALGIDVSPRAIQIARRKAAERSTDARFRVLGVLRLDELSCASATTSPASGVLGGSPKVSCTPHSVPAGGSFRSLPTASTSTRASAIPIAEAWLPDVVRLALGRWGSHDRGRNRNFNHYL